MIFLLSMNLLATKPPGPADNPDGDWNEFKNEQEALIAVGEKEQKEENEIRNKK